jgi:hypothetical protein
VLDMLAERVYVTGPMLPTHDGPGDQRVRGVSPPRGQT